MPEFLKDKNIKEFLLKDLTVHEDFGIWPSFDKRGQKITDPQGNEIKFPVREGMLVAKDGKEHDVESIKTMPGPVFKQLFPNLGKRWRWLRTIVISGVEMYYYFTTVSNRLLNEKIKDIRATGGDPLTVKFTQIYEPNRPPMEKYKIEIVSQAASAPQTPATTGQIDLTSVSTAPKPVAPVGLSDHEKAIVEALKKHPETLNEDQVRKVCEANGVPQMDRKSLIWGEYSKK